MTEQNENMRSDQEVKSIVAIQADIIFKALYYVASKEKIEIPKELTEIYEVLAEGNPNETYAEDTIEVMEYLSEFIKRSNAFRGSKEWFIEHETNNE